MRSEEPRLPPGYRLDRSDPDELAPALEAALASDTVTLLDVVTDPDIISPSTTLSEIGGESP
jgi:thiamine pyrophosphate-dependent acetolactate synthase large subunit-like protein